MGEELVPLIQSVLPRQTLLSYKFQQLETMAANVDYITVGPDFVGVR